MRTRGTKKGKALESKYQQLGWVEASTARNSLKIWIAQFRMPKMQ